MGKVMQIDENAPEVVKKALDNKEISVNKGYELTKKLQEVPEDQRETAATAMLEADKAFQEKDAEVERKGRSPNRSVPPLKGFPHAADRGKHPHLDRLRKHPFRHGGRYDRPGGESLRAVYCLR